MFAQKIPFAYWTRQNGVRGRRSNIKSKNVCGPDFPSETFCVLKEKKSVNSDNTETGDWYWKHSWEGTSLKVLKSAVVNYRIPFRN